jgi:hypothetical protein
MKSMTVVGASQQVNDIDLGSVDVGMVAALVAAPLQASGPLDRWPDVKA